MDRKELLNKLTMLQPALASNDLLPHLTHFWFDGETIMADNDHIRIRTKHASPFKGGVMGNMLVGLLKNSGAQDVVIADREDEVEFRAAGAKINLALLPPSKLFDPEEATGEKFKITGDILVPALERCLLSVTDDTSVPDQLGVSFVPVGKQTHMFSTNGHLITRVVINVPIKERAILSTEFCKQVINLAPNTDETLDFEINETFSLLTTKKATLYGKLIGSDQPLPFLEMLDHHFPAKVKKSLVEIPGTLRLAIERSLVMAAAGNGEGKLELKVVDGKLKLTTKAVVGKASIGSITDTITLKGSHPNVEAELSPKAVKVGIDRYTHMAITETCVILTDDNGGALLASTTAA